MKSMTVDYGIYLGDDKCSIAKINGIDTEIINNNMFSEFTPIAVAWYNKDSILVGTRAKNLILSNPENGFIGFTRYLGVNKKFTLKRNSQSYSPQELLSFIFKSLKEDVKTKEGEEINSVVITIPINFEQSACEAVREAANLAGFEYCILLQEPIAATMAYSLQSEKDNKFWMVYDLGRETFDTAIIQIKDGQIEVINHGGDNHLGSDDIDWEIINKLLVPAVIEKLGLKDFNRDNIKYKTDFAKIKDEVEEAKIRLSLGESVDFYSLLKNKNGEIEEFSFELTKKDFQQLVNPFIQRSINICKKVLSEKKLTPSNIEKLIMVGETSSIPYLQELLLEQTDGLGIPIDSSIDPLTIMARGAAIYASTQMKQIINNDEIQKEKISLELDYPPYWNDTEPSIEGRIISNEADDYTGYTIEFINKTVFPEWRSGKINLSSKGNFINQLWAEEDKRNTFDIELFNSKGVMLETIPQKISYTHCTVSQDEPLFSSIGIVMPKNEIISLLKKGMALPAESLFIYITESDFIAGQEQDLVNLPLVEGDNGDFVNIGSLVIRSKHISKNLSAGTEIEITLEVNTSRLLSANAYIPKIGEGFEMTIVHFGIEKEKIEDLCYGHTNDDKSENNNSMKTTKDRIIEIISDKLEIEKSKIETIYSLKSDLGADDLDIVELIMEFEKEFNIEISDERMEEVDSVSDLIILVDSILNGDKPTKSKKTTKTKAKNKSVKQNTSVSSIPIAECKILIEGAIPEIYKQNAFRISGLNVNASTRDISNQVKKNQMMEKYGDVSVNHNSPFPIEPSPDSEQVNNAMHRLRDPETRLLDEFFWFWPHNIDSSNHDEALKFLSSKDIIAAEKIWIAQEATMTESNVSKHNLAVLAHLQALDFELNGKETSEELIKNRDENWDKSFKRWHQLLEHEGFWSRLTARVRQMDDPRLTTGFVKRLRDSLPTAILQINAQLALIAAENGNEEDVQRHLDLLYSSDFGGEDILAALKRVASPLRNKIKITCKKYTGEEYPNPTDSLNASKKLIEQTAPMLRVLDLLLPKDSAILEGAHDEVALGAVGLLIDYGNNTDDIDLTDSIKVYEEVLEIALGESAKVRVEQNYEIVKRNHEYYQTHYVCFFCGKNKYDESVSIEKEMHGEVKKEYLSYQRYRWHWRHKTVIVPRCKECHDIHNGKTREHKQINKLYNDVKKYNFELNSLKNKKNTAVFFVLLVPTLLSIALLIYANYINKNVRYGDPLISDLSQLQILLYNNIYIYYVIASLCWAVGIIAAIQFSKKKYKEKINDTMSKISDCETKIKKKKKEIKHTEPYNLYVNFSEIINLKKEGWAFGKEPNMSNEYY